ncbi:MAG: copper resistance protein B [Gammaproteobacteria bacterium]
MGDSEIYHFLLIDRLEAGFGGADNINAWDAQGWIGGDYNKFWFKTEGEGVQGKSPEDAEIQALYSRTISPFWDFQAGARYDIRPNPERAHAVIGVQGLAPQWFEVDAAAFLSNKGDATFRLEVEYELLLTQRLILQPRAEINAAAQAIPELGLGSGINHSELGLRLRYEIRREFSPYIGVSWKKAWGDTANMARAAGAELQSPTYSCPLGMSDRLAGHQPRQPCTCRGSCRCTRQAPNGKRGNGCRFRLARGTGQS